MASNHELSVQVVQDGPGRVAGVFDAGKPVARIEYWLLPDMTYIADVFVDPEYRRQGIATHLLNLPGRLCLEVRIDNDGAIAFYEGSGLRVLKRIPGYYRDGTDAYYMERQPDWRRGAS